MNNMLFPPFMSQKQNGFLNSDEGRIYFNISQFNTFDQVNSIIISIVRQDNNLSALPKDGNLIIDYGASFQMNYALGFLFGKKEAIKYDESKKMYFIELPSDLLVAKTIFKIQIRLGVKVLEFSNNQVFIDGVVVNSEWMNNKNNIRSLSEWSNVGIFSTLSDFDIEIQDFNLDTVNQIETTVYTFVGMCYLNLTNPNETLKATEFNLYDETGLIESSGRIVQPANQKQYNYHSFRTIFEPGKVYSVSFQVETSNDYKKEIRYDFECILNLPEATYFVEIDNSYLGYDKNMVDVLKTGVRLNIKDRSYGSDPQNQPNSYIIRKTSSRSNFEQWEEIGQIRKAPGAALLDKYFFDTFVESGITYRYSVQSKLLNTGRGLVSDYVEITPQYEYSWLIGQNNLHLNIAYNLELSNYQTIIKETKVETIGSQYPFFVRNGNVKYRQFSISGIITKEMDVATKLYDNTLEEEYVQEREFRNQLEQLLLDGKPKVFKTDTEGLMLVYLSNITLNPERALGRRIYSFNCQVTEIADFTLENLIEHDLVVFDVDKDISDIRDIAVVGYAYRLEGSDKVYTKPRVGLTTVGLY